MLYIMLTLMKIKLSGRIGITDKQISEQLRTDKKQNDTRLQKSILMAHIF